MNDDSAKFTGTLADLVRTPPKWDLVGPTVHDDIRRAINRYGASAVRAAAADMTKPKRGRPKINDWSELREFIIADALEWLDGEDPIANRKNYSIAKEYADRHPGQSAVSTHQRIERKLASKPYGRRWYMLVTAMEMSRESYSHARHIRALEELARHDPRSTWQIALQSAKSDIADFEAKTGAPPAAELTMKQVQDTARNTLADLGPAKSPGGMFGRGAGGRIIGDILSGLNSDDNSQA